MFSRLFRKSAATPATETPNPPLKAAPEAAPKLPREAWESRLAAAQGDDPALLALAREAPGVDVKLAAVMALGAEDALKAAEREFRTHDRRVHRALRQRLQALADRRSARARADELVDAARALAAEPVIPANRLAELDQSWLGLDAVHLDAAQIAEFTARRERLAELVRARADEQMSRRRWVADAERALAQLQARCAEVAVAGGAWAELADRLAAAGGIAAAALAAPPPALPVRSVADDKPSVGDALRTALSIAQALAPRLALLAELDATPANIEPAAESLIVERWQALPPVADGRIIKALEQRFEAWQRRRHEAGKSRQGEARAKAWADDAAQRLQREQRLAERVAAAEAALAAGHLAETREQLLAIDAAGFTSAALKSRIDALQAECARLAGWQHWGGERAREELVLAAEVLAAEARAAEAEGASALPIKVHATAIDKLRERWKELDHLGGANSRGAWQRFDAALKIAYAPVAAHQAKLKAVREENLASRLRLLAAIEAQTIEGDVDWREVTRQLEHFQVEWRKLGPLEHTVPHKARPGLLERMGVAVARLEMPLREIRRLARQQREDLVVRARALSGVENGRDLVAGVRELQAEWQQQARALPLPRPVEHALWAEFKAATDALFSQREAAKGARDAALKAAQEMREGLIARLAAIDEQASAADIRRLLDDVDQQWRLAGEAPRGEAVRLEAAYRAARANAAEIAAGGAQRAWRATCDALTAKLALCQAREGGADVAELVARWAALPALPAAWELALHARFTSDSAVGANEEAFDRVILRLEAAFEIPSPPDFVAARRELKLLAMKNALEARQTGSAGQAERDQWLLAAIRRSGIDEGQRQRLAAVIAAVRSGTPRKPDRSAGIRI